MYPVLFRADVWDEKVRQDYGVTMASCYADAMTQIENYYGNDSVSSESQLPLNVLE